MDKASALRAFPEAALVAFARDEAGATAIEYALVAAGVGAAVASTVWTLGTQVKISLYDRISGFF